MKKSNSITIRPVLSRKEKRDFLHFPWEIYKNDPHWVPPLLMEQRKLINPKKNPYFQHAKAQFFVAYQDGQPVGRISAQVDQLFLDHWKEKEKESVGFFGFFESIDDQTVAQALVDHASQWLTKQGMKKIRGPFSLSINEISGVLIKGYGASPQIMMAYNPSYYETLLEKAGLQKAKDLYAWRYDVGNVPEPAHQIADAVREYPGLSIRTINIKHVERDLNIIMDVFNSAWSKNWGFTAFTPEEIKQAAKDLKKIVDPEICLIAEVEGKPAGIVFCIPNLNELIKDLKGRLFPLNFFRLLYRLKFHPPRNGRIALLGIKKEYRGSILGGLSILLYIDVHHRCQKRGYTMGELSWTLEDNVKINEGIKFMGGQHYRTYRVYEKNL